tara:strand:+ start:59 stop:244 length:186 start_codon:yes stop_codon:yes gene_type:complete
VLGMKQFGSQPGVDDPGAFVTVASANAPGTAKNPIAKTTKSDVIMMCFVLIRIVGSQLSLI